MRGGLACPGQGNDGNALHERGDFQFTDGADSEEIREFVGNDIPWFIIDPDQSLTVGSCVVYEHKIRLFKILLIIIFEQHYSLIGTLS